MAPIIERDATRILLRDRLRVHRKGGLWTVKIFFGVLTKALENLPARVDIDVFVHKKYLLLLNKISILKSSSPSLFYLSHKPLIFGTKVLHFNAL